MTKPKTAAAAETSTIHKVWTSGNFTREPQISSPYNGVTVEATAEVTEHNEMRPPVITITDFGYVKTGASVTLPPLNIADEWVPVPKGTTHVGEERGDFAVVGRLRLVRLTSGIYLHADIRIGWDEPDTVIGFLFAFDGVNMMAPQDAS